MSAYQREQLETLKMVYRYLQAIPASDRQILMDLTAEYRVYRQNVNAFLTTHLLQVCTLKCHQSRLSACCSKEGIITFFADVVINTLVSNAAQVSSLTRLLRARNNGDKCIYLGPDGCCWQIKPIVCEMFICDEAQRKILDPSPAVLNEWEEFKQLKKQYTWPDQPVLFDMIEAYFIKAGYSSPLMYLHNSPGLLRVKQQASLSGVQSLLK